MGVGLCGQVIFNPGRHRAPDISTDIIALIASTRQFEENEMELVRCAASSTSTIALYFSSIASDSRSMIAVSSWSTRSAVCLDCPW